jgi:hypothetical protein
MSLFFIFILRKNVARYITITSFTNTPLKKKILVGKNFMKTLLPNTGCSKASFKVDTLVPEVYFSSPFAMKIIKINLWNQGIRWSNTGNKIAATCNKI